MKRAVRIGTRLPLTAEVVLLELEPLDDEPLPSWGPGSHIDVFLANGLTRQYSLTNPFTTGAKYEIAVKLEPSSRGGSAAIHELQPGDVLQIGEPRNNFALAKGATHHVLLAGGIGITPLIAMARYLLVTGGSFELHVFARSAELIPFRHAIDDTKLSRFATLYPGLGSVDAVRSLEQIIDNAGASSDFYCCGPAPFMEATRGVLAGLKFPSSNAHFEAFDAGPIDRDGDTPFEVELARSGVVLVVQPNETILEVMRRNSIEVETSCEQGVCGTCLTTVLSGWPDHRDVYLTDEEQASGGQMTICCSRSLSPRLVIDR